MQLGELESQLESTSAEAHRQVAEAQRQAAAAVRRCEASAARGSAEAHAVSVERENVISKSLAELQSEMEVSLVLLPVSCAAVVSVGMHTIFRPAS